MAMTREDRLRLREVLLYLADCLVAVNDMQEMHNCNDCAISRKCAYVPMPGQCARWNCPLWQGGEREEAAP